MKEKNSLRHEHITMKQVAQRAGVSIATVSHVLNGTKPVSEKLKQTVYQAVKELQYTPNYWAQSIRKQSGNILGIIIPEIRNVFFADIIRGAEDAAYRNGYSVMICNTDNDPKKWTDYVNMLYSKRVSGLILTGAWLEKQLERNFLTSKGIPVTVVNFEHGSDTVDIVGISRRIGGRKAAEYLIELGHKTIGVIEGRKEYTSPYDFNVIEGFTDVLHTADLTLHTHQLSASYTMDDGYHAMQQILSRPDLPTALFCENDLIALGAVSAVFEAGLQVPGDISIIGFDNINFARFAHPGLTTVAVERYKIGEMAVNMILNRIRDPQISKQRVLLTPELIIRGSTRNPMPKH